MSALRSGPRVTTDLDGGVGIIRLNQPEKHNAIDAALVRELLDATRSLGDDPECRVVILTGNGPSFCSGMDLSQPMGDPALGPVRGADVAMRGSVTFCLALREIPQPVIAAVSGHAVGAGFAFAALSDLRIVAPDARFNAVFTRIGMSAGDLGISWILPRLIGFTAAADVFFRARTLSGTEALELGFATEVADDPLARAREVAAEIAERAPLGVLHTKQLLNASLQVGALREHMETERRTQVLLSFSEDYAEAAVAFHQKREPKFTGR
ncbi:enoyl-CoA hydratase/isomerase family protein [Microbacterium gorillae]|uniref:enoyl-CoA hydratase/isomerase family protein n=1 Tax=Microbacterium gorillae TaxID=1231063 RepID=UPI00058D9CF9|nr:enoyl-CoA hydratase/isomerase family protein [Microbacterium gorillae]